MLAKKTYDRVSQLAEHGNAPQARLDQATDALHESERAADQAKSAYEQAVNGYTREEREIAVANVQKAIADITAVQAIIDQMAVYAPVPSQVYKRNVERGEYVSPGVPLITLIDLNDMWSTSICARTWSGRSRSATASTCVSPRSPTAASPSRSG